MNRAERVIAFLEERPDVWIEATRFESLGGRQAWRTAISEARQIVKGDGRDIVNRTRDVLAWKVSATSDSDQPVSVKRITISEYMLVSAPPQDETRGHNTNVALAGSLF
jgi:hypothetical protein